MKARKSRGKYWLEQFVRWYGRSIYGAYKRPSQTKISLWHRKYADIIGATVINCNSQAFTVAWLGDNDTLIIDTYLNRYEYELDADDKCKVMRWCC